MQRNATQISLQILEARWRGFGHLFRRYQATPANEAIQFYFTNTNTNNFKGRPLINYIYIVFQTLKNNIWVEYPLTDWKYHNKI